MTRPLLRRPALAGLVALFALLPSGCVVGGGYSAGYAPDYYEPYGGIYGGWGSDYRVGPVRGGDRHDDHGPAHGGGAPRQHAFRAAPASHGAPSIPSAPRGGGGHSGGGRPR